ncbi:MAG TPA: hypothetical protein DDZ41_04640 [Flavobacterium sp.]|nr:hypothetical protein [Flavobacterium sp.]
MFIFFLIGFMGMTPTFSIGTNDALFFTCLTIFFSEVYHLVFKKQFNFSLAVSVLIIALFTRSLILVYLPTIIFALFIIYKNRAFYKKNIILPSITFIVLIVLNTPSILHSHKLSYDSKPSPEGITSTWAQRQYLSQLYQNKNQLPKGEWVSWEEVDVYLKDNGKDSLPEGIAETVFFDINLTINEFFKDLLESFLKGFRETSFILPIVLVYILKQIKEKKILDTNVLFICSLFVPILIIAFIIINSIETRWLTSSFVILSLFYFDSNILKNSKWLQTIVIGVFSLFCYFFLYRIIAWN